MISAIKEWNRSRLIKRHKDFNPNNQSLLNKLDYDLLISSDAFKFCKNPKPKKTDDNFCCYSTYCGDKSGLSLSADVSRIDTPFYFISNNENALKKSEKLGWIPIYLNIPVSSDILVSSAQAKIAKVLTNEFDDIWGYKKSFYLDDKLNNIPTKTKNIYNRFKSREDIAFSLHSPKNHAGNILFKFSSAMQQKRYFRQRLKTQNFIMRMLDSGLSLRCEHMYATGYIFRNHSHPETKDINIEWYKAINECGIECQISFDFIAQKYKDIIHPFNIEEI